MNRFQNGQTANMDNICTKDYSWN